MKFPQLNTDRLILRTLSLEDTEVVAEHFSDNEVTRYMDLKPDESAQDIINFHINDSGCRWGIFLNKGYTLIGTCGYHCWIEKLEAEAEIGFDLSKAYWGQGYMKEAMMPVINFGFGPMGLSVINAFVHVSNGNSRRFIEKLGFQSDAEISNNHYKYHLKKNDFI